MSEETRDRIFDTFLDKGSLWGLWGCVAVAVFITAVQIILAVTK